MSKIALLMFVLASFHVQADYYLKFETSGGSHDPDTLFSANTNTWIKLSIVDAYPTDGPVHYPDSHTGAFTRFDHKSTGVDHLKFYVAEIPRSVTVINKSNGSRKTITAGDEPEDFPGAPSPAFYMPDSLLVTTGLSQDFVADVFKVYMAATMPMTRLGDQAQPFGIAHKSNGQYIETYSKVYYPGCMSGWAPSKTDGDGFTMVQSIGMTTQANNCDTRMMSKGRISHVIRFE